MGLFRWTYSIESGDEKKKTAVLVRTRRGVVERADIYFKRKHEILYPEEGWWFFTSNSYNVDNCCNIDTDELWEDYLYRTAGNPWTKEPVLPVAEVVRNKNASR